MDIRERIIVALDFPNMDTALECAGRLNGSAKYVKVGMQLYYAAGPKIIEVLKKEGFKIFLDLKVHDIPNTAKGAMQSLGELGVDMVNVHAAGGLAMMQAAFEGLNKGAARSGVSPLLIAVTQLTSTTKEMMNGELGIEGSIEDCVVRYARLAKEAGLSGVVASPLEVQAIKEACGKEFITVTPGIRPLGSDIGDQKRMTTPDQAFTLGSDYIVIGRPITGAQDPHTAMEEIVRSVNHE
ncbi:MAG TPA: orotidine-5'-phosphate decarboxylase [Bacillota bacterium]|nr:orotidine-5'-phosphate decarboxylase [Bacillota bacterium]